MFPQQERSRELLNSRLYASNDETQLMMKHISTKQLAFHRAPNIYKIFTYLRSKVNLFFHASIKDLDYL